MCRCPLPNIPGSIGGIACCCGGGAVACTVVVGGGIGGGVAGAAWSMAAESGEVWVIVPPDFVESVGACAAAAVVKMAIKSIVARIAAPRRDFIVHPPCSTWTSADCH